MCDITWYTNNLLICVIDITSHSTTHLARVHDLLYGARADEAVHGDITPLQYMGMHRKGSIRYG
jgi:hypothetical protein